jgi:hypothetical protein
MVMLRGRAGSSRHLRKLYKKRWEKEWPEDDEYLRELTREAKTLEEVLSLMRECHHWEK